jgi:hypothetical protein
MLLQFQANRGRWLPKALPNQEEGELDRISAAEAAFFESFLILQKHSRAGRPRKFIRGRNCLAHQATATARNGQNASPVAGLARFFPDATSMRVPVQLARVIEAGAPTDFSESTVIEFGTPREILFASQTPLDFADILRIRNSDGSLDEEVRVVAVQYQTGKTLVAARFRRDVPNWIVKS